MGEHNYRSGGDFTLEFVGHRYHFSHRDFTDRVTAAARRLGLTPGRDLTASESADLVELVTRGDIVEPRSGLGHHLNAHRRELSTPAGEDVVYWLRKLIFRAAWLDGRVKAGVVEARFDEARGGFAYVAEGHELPVTDDDGVPNWSALRYRRR